MITQLVGILLVLIGGVIIGYVIARITSNGTQKTSPPLYSGPPPNKEWIYSTEDESFSYETCPTCNGFGKKEKCEQCNNTCFIRVKKENLPWWITRITIKNDI